MEILELASGALIGLCIGAFTWQLADQQIRDRLFSLKPVCLDCGNSLPMTAWLPFPALFTKAACPTCQDIDHYFRNWLVAIALYFTAVMYYVDSWDKRGMIVVGSLALLLILAIDLKSSAIFVSDCVVAVLIGLGLALFDGPSEGVSALLGLAIAVATTAFFLVISRWILRSMSLRVSPIGKSDLFVAAAVGAFARSSTVVPTLVIAVLIAALLGIAFPVASKRFRTFAIPFGPCLIAGALLSQLL